MFRIYNFTKHYLKGGIAPLDKITLGLIEKIQQKYSIDYLTFIRELEGLFPAGPVKDKLQNLKKDIQKIIRLMGSLRGVRGVRATKVEVKQLYSSMQRIDKEIRNLQNLAENVEEIREAVVQAQIETDVTLEGLALVHSQIHQTFKETRTKRHGILSEAFMGAITGLGWKIAYGLGGKRFAGVIGVGTRMYGLIKSAREKKAGHFIDEILAPMAKMPSGLEGSMPGDEGVFRGGKPIFGRSAKAEKDLRAAAAPIWYFFHYQAGKAKWTKEVLRLLKRNAGDSKASKILGVVEDAKDVNKIVIGTTVGTIIAGAIKGALPKILKGGLKFGGATLITASAVYVTSQIIDVYTNIGKLNKQLDKTQKILYQKKGYISRFQRKADEARAEGNIPRAEAYEKLVEESKASNKVFQADIDKLKKESTIGNILFGSSDTMPNLPLDPMDDTGEYLTREQMDAFDKSILDMGGNVSPRKRGVPKYKYDVPMDHNVPVKFPPFEDFMKAIKDLEKTIENAAPAAAQPVSMQMREPYDSGDDLLRSFVSGRLDTA